VPNRLFLFLLTLLLAIPLRGQDDGPIKMTPELALTFPVVKVGEDITVKYPILVNPATVLKPGMVLRTLYILNNNSADATSDLVLAHKGNMEQSFSRSTMSTDEQSKMPPELAHQLEGYRRTVWSVTVNFQLALAQLSTDNLHLIYSTVNTDRTKELQDTRFSFFDGIFVGLPDGKITVLAVENGSKADLAGIKAGEQILSVGGIPTQTDLTAFAAAYAAAKKAAKDDEASSFPISLRSPGQSESHTTNIGMPPRIKSSLMDGF
jgi:hypothetical protein